MASSIRDLISLYEPVQDGGASSSLPRPSPARFLKHPSRRQSAPVAPLSSEPPTGSTGQNNERIGVGASLISSPRPPSLGGLHSQPERISTTTKRRSLPAPELVSSQMTLISRKNIGEGITQDAKRDIGQSSTNVRHDPFADDVTSYSSAWGTNGNKRQYNSNSNSTSSLPTDLGFIPKPRPHSLQSSITKPSNSQPPISSSAPHNINDPFQDFSPATPTRPASTSLTSFSGKTLADTYIPLQEMATKDTQSAPLLSRKIAKKWTHQPIPAHDVFSRGAAPLHLPDLDAYLSKITPPSFQLPSTSVSSSLASSSSHPRSSPSQQDKKESSLASGIFPPLEKLKGQTIDELQHNSKVPSPFMDRNFLLGSVITGIIGVAGSSVIAGYYSLQGLYDAVQIFALVLASVVPKSSLDDSNKWRTLFLHTIPNILALNIPTKLTGSLIFLIILMAICGLLLFQFYKVTESYSPSAFREGRQPRQPSPTASAIIVTFLLTVLYLPLSTIAVHGILWSSDFWVVPNPYTNTTVSLDQLPPLGPSDVWREPLDFCYTTTMRKDEVNYAPVIATLSGITFIFMTLWFPIRLMQTIRQSLPKVDPYTELGQKRSRGEMELEYQRLIERDHGTFGFLYRDFRRAWGAYKSVYLWAKLSALLIVAVLSSDNCAFRSLDRSKVDIARQSVLTLSMLGWFLLQCFLVPFLDPVSNASEWTSRLNYVLTSGTGLLVAFKVPGSSVLKGPVLYIIYVVTYGLDAYFALIGTGFMRRLVKKLAGRLDFSIDIFSPKLDLTADSRHLRRRIWQETVGTLILTDEDCRIPPKHHIKFSEPQNFEWPPYLLDFQGTVGERHVENVKILREVGLKRYSRAVTLMTGPERKLFDFLSHRIQSHFVGPDSYWKPAVGEKLPSGRARKCSGSCFGNAWWIPFPPTLVIRYDQGGEDVLDSLHDFERYVTQNESHEVVRKKSIRMALRALDRQIVYWPYIHVEPVGSRHWFSGERYSMQSTIRFQSCVFELKHQGVQFWHDLDLGSGFEVQLTYSKKVKLDGTAIGLDHDIDMNPTLAKFLSFNRHLIQTRSTELSLHFQDYRKHSRKEVDSKHQVLSYHFLTMIYNWPSRAKNVITIIDENEPNEQVRHLFSANQSSLDVANERMKATGRSEVTVWWYLLWDDLWRKNHDTIAGLGRFAQDFNPIYTTSIAYRPLPRPALEAFLGQRGLLSTRSTLRYAIHTGFLNKVYFRLNQIVFHNTDKVILIHVGHAKQEMDLEDLDLTTHVRSSTMGTGGGTDLDDISIRARPTFRWEDVFDDPIHSGHKRLWSWLSWRRWRGMLAVWLGITPLDHRRIRTNGIAFDLRLDNSRRYVKIEQ